MPERRKGSAIVPVQEALDEIRAGRMIILMDDEDRENEGDLCVAAERVTPEHINFMATYGRGLICLSLTEGRCEQLAFNPNQSGMNPAAIEYSRVTTFKNDLGGQVNADGTPQTTWGQTFQKLANDHPSFRQIMPFQRTPVNLARWSWERTPVLANFSKIERTGLRSFASNVGLGGYVAVGHDRLLLVLRVVLAQRVADEPFVEQDRTQIIVASKDNPVHVVAFPLHEASRTVETNEGVHCGIVLGDAGLEPDADPLCRGVEVVHKLEARRLPKPVDRGHVEEQVELELGLQPLHGAVQLRRLEHQHPHAVLQNVQHVRGHDQKSLVKIGCREPAILSCSFMMPSITVSGRGGQPGT